MHILKPVVMVAMVVVGRAVRPVVAAAFKSAAKNGSMMSFASEPVGHPSRYNCISQLLSLSVCSRFCEQKNLGNIDLS